MIAALFIKAVVCWCRFQRKGRDADEEARAACEAEPAPTAAVDKMRVWDTIQRPYDDPAMEIMSRFAQVAFSEAALRFDSPA